MVTLRDSMLSSSARRLPIRRRPDLQARRQHYLGRSYWIVKDPVGLQYFRFQDEEYAILQMLDGETSLDEIKDRFEAEFPPQKITLDELQQFLGMLHRSGLVIAGVGGQGEQLLKRRRERRRKELLGALANILCIRFKGFDPERFLNWLYPKIRWFFSPTAFFLSVMLILAAGLLVTVKFHDFQSRLPAFHQFFSIHNAILLSIVLGLTKVLHEFGHGLMCKHFGGECHEMGVMILVLTPCLYCNVSDSWMLPSKWQRAAIGAGGMYVELVLASICTFIWWNSSPGLLNYICLNVMFVSSVSTLIFNANPLLRYDGYYILADLTEIPNLRQKATTILGRKMGEWCLGLEPPEDPFLPERNQVFFAVFSIASTIYRWVVVFSILFFLYAIFKPYRLEKIGELMVMASLWGLLVMPFYQLYKYLRVPGRLEKVKKNRLYATLAIGGALLLGVALVPLPYSVMASLELQPRGAQLVYVEVPGGGRLAEVRVKPYQRVAKGQVLAVLENKDLDIQIAQLEAKIADSKTEIDNLRRQAAHNPRLLGDIPQVEETIAANEEKLARKQREKARFHLRADRDGVVIPPPVTPHRKGANQEFAELSSWSDTPLEEKNLGAPLKEDVLFCLVGDPRQFEAVLIIDQIHVEFVKEGQQVSLKLDQLPFDTIDGRIEGKPSVDPLMITPQRLSTKAGGEVASTTDPATGMERPQSTSYQALVPVVDKEGVLRPGLRGQAKIHTASLSLGSRLWRFVLHTFNFRM